MREHVRHRVADALAGAACGVAGSAATAISNAVLDRIVSSEQKLRDKATREGTGHQVVTRRLAEKLGGGKPGAAARAVAAVSFATAFGIGWGLVYTAVRKRVPAVSRLGGLAFALPFFGLCDGVLAPALGLSPSPRRVPWQLNAKELANHVVWTAATELTARLADRLR